MKKIYTIAAAALCVSVAYASAPAVSTESKAFSKKAQAEEMIDLGSSLKKVDAKSVTRADESWKSLGEGAFRECIFSSIWRGMDAVDIPCEIQQNTVDPNQYRVVNPYANFQLPFTDVEYDATGEYYVYITVFEYDGKKLWYMPSDEQTGLIFPAIDEYQGTPIEGMTTIGTQAGELALANTPEVVLSKFGEKAFGVVEGDGIFTYPASFDFNGTTYNNMMLFFSSIEGIYFSLNTKKQFCVTLPGVTPPAPADPFDGLTLVGNGKMVNPILENFYGEKAPKEMDVVIYEEPNTPGYYHVKHAWNNWALAEFRDTADFEINARDQNYVMLPDQETGYVDNEGNEGMTGTVNIMSSSYFYCYATGGTPMTPAQFAEAAPELVIKVDKAANRIVFPGPAIELNSAEGKSALSPYCYYFPEGGNSVYFYDNTKAAGGYLQFPAGYVWPENGSAVEDIDVDNANAPVEYYNLQGVKVLNPEAGTLVIKKQGSKVSKLIVK